MNLHDVRISKASRPVLSDYLRRGAKPTGEHKCGLEWEVFGYENKTLARLDASRVQAVLKRYATAADKLYYENDGTLASLCLDELGHLTIEPGGQIEFSGRAHRGLREAENDLKTFTTRLRAAGEAEDSIFLCIGFDPLRNLAEQHWFPKMRYDLMRPFFAAYGGARAWDMMTRTCAVQVNLDYSAEDDLFRKFLLGNRLAPIITAIFANSPFENGRPSGYKSTRAAAWLATDAKRAGISPIALDDDATLDDFVAYSWQVPMLFLRRGERYNGVFQNLSFAEFLDAATADAADDYYAPVMQDYIDHLTTIFTDARLKQYLELRSIDGGSLTFALAAAALWKGLLYDPTALAEALRLMPNLNAADAAALRESVAREGLAARFNSLDVLALAKQALVLATEGLNRIAPEETHYLNVLHQMLIADEVSPADILLRNWRGSWHGRMSKVFEYVRC